MMLVDSHCHLDFPEFAPELAEVGLGEGEVDAAIRFDDVGDRDRVR